MTRRITVRSGSVPRKVNPPASVASAAGVDTDAIHDNVDGEISAIDAKGSPDDTDFLLIEDAAADDAKKRITIGDLPLNGAIPVKTDTGDPGSPFEGQIYVNTFDNKVRVYADAAWHDLATW